MQTCDPMHARAWFNWREPINWGISIALMAILFSGLMLYTAALAAFLIALAAVSCLHFFVLSQRPIGVVCPHCKGYIETNKPWICPNKGCRNDHIDDFPFIHRCETCGYYPTGYECHHCRKPIFFTKDRQQAGIARCAYVPVKSEPKRVKRDQHVEEITKLRKSIERKELEKTAGTLDVELKGIRQTLEGPKMKSIEELYRAELKNEDDERRLRAAIDEEFKNDKEERKRRHLILDALMKDGPW